MLTYTNSNLLGQISSQYVIIITFNHFVVNVRTNFNCADICPITFKSIFVLYIRNNSWSMVRITWSSRDHMIYQWWVTLQLMMSKLFNFSFILFNFIIWCWWGHCTPINDHHYDLIFENLSCTHIHTFWKIQIIVITSSCLIVAMLDLH